MIRKLKTGLAASLVALAFCTQVFAQEITIRVGLTDPLDTPYGEAMTEFKKIMEEGGQGRIAVQLFPSAQLGAAAEQLENTKTGVQEIALFSPAYASRFFPKYNVLELPFLVTNWEEAQRMLASDAYSSLVGDASQAMGIRIIGNFPYGFRNVANGKHAVNTLEDFRGLKLRTQPSQVHIAAFEALGASPVAVDWNETYQAVQSGVVDGLENANTVLIANKYPEIAKYVSVTRHLFGMLTVAMNAEMYDGFSDDDRALLERAMDAAEEINIRRALEIEQKSRQTLVDMGAEVNDVAPDQTARMREAVKPVYDRFGADFQPYLADLQKAVATN